MRKLTLIICMFMSVNLFATNYYVNSSTGNNRFNGLTPSTAKQDGFPTAQLFYNLVIRFL